MSDLGILNIEGEVGHPLRRTHGGPSDVEWALLVKEVENMKGAVEKLTQAVQQFNEYAISRCGACQNAKDLEDHERRIRYIEKMIWKGMGMAAVGASLLSFFLNKVFKNI